jgi:hypothetical protein
MTDIKKRNILLKERNFYVYLYNTVTSYVDYVRKLEFGSVICAHSSKRILTIFSSIHSSAICLCTGAFRMSRVESLYTESGEHALATL